MVLTVNALTGAALLSLACLAASSIATIASAKPETPDTSASLPAHVQAYLERVMPDVATSIAGDETLLAEVGARRATDLEAATYDLAHQVRFFRLDSELLATASRLSEALAPTEQYCVPYCTNGLCRTLLCFNYDARTNATSLLSVGRADQAGRLREGARRVQALLETADRPHKVVTVGDFEFYATRDAVSGEDYLVPVTQDQADALSAMNAGRPMDKVSLDEARRLVDASALELTADADAGAATDDAIDTAAGQPARDVAPAELEPASRTHEDAALGYAFDDVGLGRDQGHRIGGDVFDRYWQQIVFLLVGTMLLMLRHRRRRYLY